MTVRPIVVGGSELAVAAPPSRLVVRGLGSCVAVTLHDPVAREWTGGDLGRSLTFDPDSGRLEVSSVLHGVRTR